SRPYGAGSFASGLCTKSHKQSSRPSHDLTVCLLYSMSSREASFIAANTSCSFFASLRSIMNSRVFILLFSRRYHYKCWVSIFAVMARRVVYLSVCALHKTLIGSLFSRCNIKSLIWRALCGKESTFILIGRRVLEIWQLFPAICLVSIESGL